MSKLTRVFQKQFGVNAGDSDVGIFGSLAASNPQYSKDPETIQSLNAFLTGWAAETIANNRPALEDFNALDFLAFYQLCYLFQAGVPEWDASTTYYTGSIVNNGTGVLYKSLVDNNLNNAVSDGTKWAEVGALSINGLTEKTTPVSADIMVIEDSAESYAKKKVQMTNLPNAGMKLVQSGAVTTQSSFTISNLTAGKKYRLVFNFTQNTNNGIYKLTFNGDEGSNYSYGVTVGHAGGNTYGGGTGTFISLGYPNGTNGVATTATYPIAGFIDFQARSTTSHSVLVNALNAGYSSSNVWYSSMIGGIYQGAADVTSLTISTSAGTMTGSWSLYELS